MGLIGEWGVGKSFVLNKLKDALGELGLPVFYFDAWKYGGESVKRSLLDVIFHDEKTKLDQKKKEEWLRRLYTSKTRPISPVTRTSLTLILWHLVLPLAFGTIAYLIIHFVIRYQVAQAVGAGVLIALLVLSVQIFGNLVSTAWETLSVPPVASPEEFDRIFKDILKVILDSPTSRGPGQQVYAWIARVVSGWSGGGRVRDEPLPQVANDSAKREPDGQRPKEALADSGLQIPHGESNARRSRAPAKVQRPRAIILIDELDRCSPESRDEVLQG
ncbi:MAG: P-loop NTPase fold protein, partial [Blastocatellia bacterium]